jgi:hypothetical protein
LTLAMAVLSYFAGLLALLAWGPKEIWAIVLLESLTLVAAGWLLARPRIVIK